jgi:hypothetical protein
MRRQHVIRRRIFVGCEGDSEVSYIARVRRVVDDVHQKVYLDAQPLQPGGGDPLDLARRAEEVIRKGERNREPYVERYLLIDRDRFGGSPERDQRMRVILNRINARVIWQDPAHEAFVLRHLPGCAMRAAAEHRSRDAASAPGVARVQKAYVGDAAREPHRSRGVASGR